MLGTEQHYYGYRRKLQLKKQLVLFRLFVVADVVIVW